MLKISVGNKLKPLKKPKKYNKFQNQKSKLKHEKPFQKQPNKPSPINQFPKRKTNHLIHFPSQSHSPYNKIAAIILY